MYAYPHIQIHTYLVQRVSSNSVYVSYTGGPDSLPRLPDPLSTFGSDSSTIRCASQIKLTLISTWKKFKESHILLNKLKY